MTKPERTITYIVVTPAGEPMIRLESKTPDEAIAKALVDPACAPCTDWASLQQRGYKIGELHRPVKAKSP